MFRVVTIGQVDSRVKILLKEVNNVAYGDIYRDIYRGDSMALWYVNYESNAETTWMF